VNSTVGRLPLENKNVQLTEVKFVDLSDISHRIFIHKYPRHGEVAFNDEILVIEFTGKHGLGSEGNGDSLFMATIVKAAMNVWYVNGLVLDLRGLAYEWGNSIGDVLLAAKHVLGQQFPTAVVVSDLCKPALESAAPFYASDSVSGGQTSWLFDNLESAGAYVKELIKSSRHGGREKKSFWRK
jgi:hypothetical protein